MTAPSTPTPVFGVIVEDDPKSSERRKGLAVGSAYAARSQAVEYRPALYEGARACIDSARAAGAPILAHHLDLLVATYAALVEGVDESFATALRHLFNVLVDTHEGSHTITLAPEAWARVGPRVHALLAEALGADAPAVRHFDWTTDDPV